MRVFVTGASGHIGSALVPELLAQGHDVVGLARSDASASKLVAAGAVVHRGDLDDLDGLRAAAAGADGVIHLAFSHETAFSGSPEGYGTAATQELRALHAIGEALVNSGKPFVTTVGTAALAFAKLGRPGTEEDTMPAGPRVDAENATIALAQRSVRTSSVRLPPTVHSTLDHAGFIPSLIAMARKTGFSVYVGDGSNVWPAVHTLDVARLYRLALESAPAGTRLHGVAEEGVPFRAIAETIGKGLGLPAKSITPEEAPHHLGFLARFAGVDNPTSSTRTRALLQWEPTHPGLLADIAEGHYLTPRS
ncbi:SDR family oxidoreductase [Chondromyces crocatus]|uniref:3-beta hydroxysteroid dehydrogenase n=1 Tax=Chondromyces crocatus TaxID=52 RepID=A0A0K1ERH3_CHOCO|nr:SDR family oxidoreductase [Chondromyces crocatus]AKT43419.1 3-beta hydroxysteroid dehydrogenase [Chondromyces crocatus]